VYPPPEAQDERFALVEGGANGSARAARIFGVVARAEFAAVGIAFELTGTADSVDASTRSGIRFAARSGSDASNAVTVRIVEGHRGSEAARCPECWLAAQIRLESDWKEYTLRFDELSAPPGSNRTDSETRGAMRFYGVRFELDTPGAFDLWIDELRFVRCRGSSQTR